MVFLIFFSLRFLLSLVFSAAAATGPPSSEEAKTKGEKKRKKRRGLDLISSFLNKCIMTEKKDHMCTAISTHVV